MAVGNEAGIEIKKMRQVQGTTGAATGAAGSMQHRGAHAGKGCTGDVHAGGAEQACTAGNSGREQIGRAAQGAGRDGQRRPGRTHMQEGKERGLGPAAACRCSAQGIRGARVFI